MKTINELFLEGTIDQSLYWHLISGVLYNPIFTDKADLRGYKGRIYEDKLQEEIGELTVKDILDMIPEERILSGGSREWRGVGAKRYNRIKQLANLKD